MEYIYTILLTLMGIASGLAGSQWIMWRSRAVTVAHEMNHLKGHIEGMQQQLNLVADERKLHHDTLQEVFDFIDNHSPWGANDIDMMKLRNTLMHVLKDSSVGRV